MSQTQSGGRFVSIKWKALVFTSLVLLVVTGAFVALNRWELHRFFEQHRETLHEQYALQVPTLLKRSSERLQRFTTVMASLPNVRAMLGMQRSEDLMAAFEPFQSSLELNLGIENVTLVSANGERLAAHGTGSAGEWPPDLADAIGKAISSERPQSLSDCSEACLQYAIAPVLGATENLGVLVLGTSLADVVLDFQGVSGMDLGLLIEQHNMERARNVEPERWLDPWKAKVVALTHYETNLKMLREIAERGVSINRLGKRTRINFEGKELEVQLTSLTGFSKGENAHLAVIADISGPVEHIREATRNGLYLGISGLLISELLLLAILWAPMSRLRRAAENLPQLAEGAFAQVRTAISGSQAKRFVRDEVDVLNETAIALSHQLEALNDVVAKRTRDLSDRMLEITRERNFVTHVLETAQAIILTQDRYNAILMVNPYGLTLTGYGREEMQGMPVYNLLTRVHKNSPKDPLAELVAGVREHFEEECELICKDGQTLDIVWHHSRLHGQGHDGAIILSVGMDITARKQAELRLAWLAEHDPLTGLSNRRRFEKELEQAIAASKRYQHSGALLFFDLDQFKYVNDTSGHRAGDQLLQSLGESLPTLLREVDVIGRLGGDEFAVILSRANADEAIQVAKKILAHIRGTEFSSGERIHKVTASIGIALFPEHGSDVEDLLARADLAMYQVKDTGRGGWYLLSEDDQSHRRMQERVLWKQRVEKALAEDRFTLYVQPIVSIADRSIRHYEVLLRMLGEDGSIIAPAQFIEVAERSGLINAIDHWVLDKSIQFLAKLRDQGQRETLAVNLSAHAFNDPELVKHLQRLLLETKLEPEQLVFEMTETAALADITAAQRLMGAINDIGCQFALDDFGTGFSSFFYLRQLPFEFIKIDGSFIRNLADRPDDQVLVKAMGEIAIAFGKKAIAEQVEDAEALSLLEQYGIDYAQGYYTGKPMEIARITAQSRPEAD